MSDVKTIFVTGATGNQGGAVVRSLLNNGFRVKALTRHPDSPAAQILSNLHAQIIRGNLNNLTGFKDHLENVDGIFCVLSFENGIHQEIKQGKELANLAKEFGIRHFLYSSVFGSELQTGIPHWESKYIIENHIKQLRLPYTIIRPGSLMENFLIPAVKKRIKKGILASPLNKHVIQLFIGASDIGQISTVIFSKPDLYLGKTIPIIAEKADLEKVSGIFSNLLDREVKYQKLPMILTRIIMGKNLSMMFKWINKNYNFLLNESEVFKSEFSNMSGLSEWIKINFKINS
jgi:uncharacterized protein YbjT (DUF2867 family)